MARINTSNKGISNKFYDLESLTASNSYLKIFTLGVRTPLQVKIVSAKLSPSQFSRKSLTLTLQGGGVEVIPEAKISDLISGKQIELSDTTGEPYAIQLAKLKLMAKGGEIGSTFKHKHYDYITIELIEPTSKGWKVMQTETANSSGKKLRTPKQKTAFFSKADINDLFVPSMAKGGGVEKVGKVMHEFKEGSLHSGRSGKIVKDRKQAIAIALSEAGMSKKMAYGGSIEDENAEMVESQNKAISHHTKELQSQLNMGKDTPAWVVSKVSRASNDLSDVTHYLDGEKMAKGGKMANGGGVGGDNEVLSFFKNLDYSKLPPAFSEYIKNEVLTDADLQYFSPREPIFLEIKSKVEAYTNKGASTTPATETGDSDEKKKVLQEIADLEGIKEFVSGEELIKINKELDDLNGLLPIL